MKKTRLYILSTSAYLSFLLILACFNVSEDLSNILYFIVYPVSFIFLFWIITGKAIHKDALILVIIYPLSSIAPLVFLVNRLIVVYEANEYLLWHIFVYFIIFFIVHYILVNISNLFNGTVSRYIPLEQVARTAQFILSIFIIYINVFLFLSSVETDKILYFTILIISIFIQVYVSSFFSKFQEVFRDPYIGLGTNTTTSYKSNNKKLFSLLLRSYDLSSLKEAIFVVLIMVLFIFALIPWNIVVFLKTLNITLVYYLTFNLLLESKHRIQNNIHSLYIEYIFVLVVILFTVLMNGEWGIYGKLLF